MPIPAKKAQSLPVNALKILAEFAGAQIDRLIALSGGFSDEEGEKEVIEAAEHEAPVEEARKLPLRNPRLPRLTARNPHRWNRCVEECSPEEPAVE